MSTIIPINAFKDNYIWMLTDDVKQEAWVVDPGDASVVLSALEKSQFTLAGILLTHHHHDHSDGISELIKTFKNIPVYAGKNSAIKSVNQRLSEGDKITCGPYTFSILEIPGHTLDHIAFYNDQEIFCGDTLFSAGCGRVFEGTPPQMYQTLQKIASLHDQMKIYCGHEYTLANLQFAETVEPDNAFILQKIQAVRKLRDEGQPSLPSFLKDEKKMNPFLRCTVPAVIQAVEHYAKKKLANPVEVFAYLREWKNNQ